MNAIIAGPPGRELVVRPVEGEPRILDTDLARAPWLLATNRHQETDPPAKRSFSWAWGSCHNGKNP